MFATIFMLTPSPFKGAFFLAAPAGVATAPAIKPATAAVAMSALAVRFMSCSFLLLLDPRLLDYEGLGDGERVHRHAAVGEERRRGGADGTTEDVGPRSDLRALLCAEGVHRHGDRDGSGGRVEGRLDEGLLLAEREGHWSRVVGCAVAAKDEGLLTRVAGRGARAGGGVAGATAVVAPLAVELEVLRAHAEVPGVAGDLGSAAVRRERVDPDD